MGFKLKAVAALGFIGAGLSGLAFMKDREMKPDFIEYDRFAVCGRDGLRKFSGTEHLAVKTVEVLTYFIPIFEIYFLRKMDPGFREKIMLVTTIANECEICGVIHKRFGRLAGLTDEEMRELETLDSANIGSDDRIALMWVRSYLDFEGEVPESVSIELKETFDEGERRRIYAAMIGIFYANLWSNTVFTSLRKLIGSVTDSESAHKECEFIVK